MNEKRSAHTKKPTLLSIRQQTEFSTEQVARVAGVTIGEAYTVEIGGFAHKEIAEKVVRAFSLLTGRQYTLNDIKLHNVSSARTESHARFKEEWTML